MEEVEAFWKSNFEIFFLKELRETLEQELDFINEGKNGEKCARQLKKFNFIHVPKIFWDLTTTVINHFELLALPWAKEYIHTRVVRGE